MADEYQDEEKSFTSMTAVNLTVEVKVKEEVKTDAKSAVRPKEEAIDVASGQMLEGEVTTLIVEANCIKNKTMFKGNIMMTTYKLSFIPDDPGILSHLCLHPNYFDVPLGMLARYRFLLISGSAVKVIDKKLYSHACIDIVAKDGREFRFLFLANDKRNLSEIIHERIRKFALCEDVGEYFAFGYKREFAVDGWEVYEDAREWERMGIDFDAKVALQPA